VRHQELILGLAGQTFYFDPPEGQAAGTSTVKIWLATNDDTNAEEVATTGACSVDSVSTTFSASAGATSITVASGTGIAKNRRYLITDATTGASEWIDVLSIVGTAVRVRQPLVNTYAASSTFKGTRISIAVDSTWVANAAHLTDVLSGSWRTDVEPSSNVNVGQAGYRLRWAYTVNSVACIGYSFADLVRYQAKNLVTPIDVDSRFPGWIDRLPPDYREDQGASLVLEAFHAVRMDAMADAVLLRKVRNTEILRELVILRANLTALENQALSGAGNAESLALAQGIYKQRYDQLLREPKVPTDAGDGGASSPAPRLSVFRR
jgi:hypothetical protein